MRPQFSQNQPKLLSEAHLFRGLCFDRFFKELGPVFSIVVEMAIYEKVCFVLIFTVKYQHPNFTRAILPREFPLRIRS